MLREARNRTGSDAVRLGRSPWSLLLLVFVVSCTWGERPAERLADRVFVIGWDGADWKLVEPLLEAGAMPHLARLMAKGAHGSLETIRPTLSPIVWTSIATGTTPDKHGIVDFWRQARPGESMRSPGEQEQIAHLTKLGYIEPPVPEAPRVMYRSSDRQSPALWNLLDERGLSSDVVSWWATYPAEAVRGCIVSDRYVFNRWELVSSKLNVIYDTGDQLVHPAMLEERLRPRLVRLEDVTNRDLAPFVAGETRLSSEPVLHSKESELRMALAKDESVVRMTELLLGEQVPSLLMMYVQGIDITSHYFWKYRFSDEWNWIYPDEAVSDEEVHRYGRAIEAYYELQDRRLGEILRYADSRTAILVCSDHGFTTGRYGHSTSVSGMHWTSAPPGILILSGAGVRTGITLDRAHVLDIAPTVLALLGLPPSSSMDGHVLTEALTR